MRKYSKGKKKEEATNSQTMVQKHIGFTQTVLDIAEPKAEKAFSSFPEYVRYLVINDIRNELEVEELEGNELKDTIEGIKQIQRGESVTVKSKKELDDLLASL